MSESATSAEGDNTREFRKEKTLWSAASKFLGVLALIAAMTAGFAKSYYETPLKLQEHDKKIERLERNAEAMGIKLQEQRELLLEIRGDLKVLNRASRNTVRTIDPAEN